MFDRFEKHHLGFIIPRNEKEAIERKFGKKFYYDAIQQTHVLFVFDESLRIYIEYICQEGRADRQKPGFAHICYTIKDKDDLKNVEQLITENNMGYKLTDCEKSGSKECGFVTFYYIKNIGVVELNLLEDLEPIGRRG